MLDQLGIEPDDPRRAAVTLVNPLSDEEPDLRTTLIPGLLNALRRNYGRGTHDLALFETGPVFRATGDEKPASRLVVDRRPTDDEIASLDASSRSSRGAPPWCSPGAVSRTAGGAPHARRSGRTPSRRAVRSHGRRVWS